MQLLSEALDAAATGLARLRKQLAQGRPAELAAALDLLANELWVAQQKAGTAPRSPSNGNKVRAAVAASPDVVVY